MSSVINLEAFVLSGDYYLYSFGAINPKKIRELRIQGFYRGKVTRYLICSLNYEEHYFVTTKDQFLDGKIVLFTGENWLVTIQNSRIRLDPI